MSYTANDYADAFWTNAERTLNNDPAPADDGTRIRKFVDAILAAAERTLSVPGVAPAFVSASVIDSTHIEVLLSVNEESVPLTAELVGGYLGGFTLTRGEDTAFINAELTDDGSGEGDLPAGSAKVTLTLFVGDDFTYEDVDMVLSYSPTAGTELVDSYDRILGLFSDETVTPLANPYENPRVTLTSLAYYQTLFFKVTFTGGDGHVKISTLDRITLQRAGGGVPLTITATLVSTEPAEDAEAVVATYSAPGPSIDGYWTPDADGTVWAIVAAEGITDVDDRPLAAGVVGTFRFSMASNRSVNRIGLSRIGLGI